MAANTKPNENASDKGKDKDDLTINTQDPPAGMPDIGAPGMGADEMPGGAITGGDGKAGDGSGTEDACVTWAGTRPGGMLGAGGDSPKAAESA